MRYRSVGLGEQGSLSCGCGGRQGERLLLDGVYERGQRRLCGGPRVRQCGGRVAAKVVSHVRTRGDRYLLNITDCGSSVSFKSLTIAALTKNLAFQTEGHTFDYPVSWPLLCPFAVVGILAGG